MANPKPWFTKGISNAAAKNHIGEIIYTRVHPLYPKVAGKITGMILDATTIQECDVLLDDAAAFTVFVEQAVKVLKASNVPVD